MSCFNNTGSQNDAIQAMEWKALIRKCLKLQRKLTSEPPNQKVIQGYGFNWAYHNSLLGHEVWCLTTAGSRKNIETYPAVVLVSQISTLFI